MDLSPQQMKVLSRSRWEHYMHVDIDRRVNGIIAVICELPSYFNQTLLHNQ